VECWGVEFEVVVATKREVGPGRSLPYSNRARSWAIKLPQQHLQSLTAEAVRKRGCDSTREAETQKNKLRSAQIEVVFLCKGDCQVWHHCIYFLDLLKHINKTLVAGFPRSWGFQGKFFWC
jgi:hypothetical protein